MIEGIIVKGIGGFYYVQTQDALVECKAKGLMRIGKLTPIPGDRVKIELLEAEDGKGVIVEILERTSLLTRPAVANINQLFIVISCTQPEPDLLLADKLIISAMKHKIKPILVVNKIDLKAIQLDAIAAQYLNTGFETVFTSALTGEGIEEIFSLMKGKISGFAGQSGVGKSSLLNALLQRIAMLTGTLGDKSFRGKHTTRHAELFALEQDGFVLDTPGFSNYELEDIMYDELWTYYPEMLNDAEACRFAGCIHVAEPNCRIKALVDEGAIDQLRYQRYLFMVMTLKEVHKNRWR